MKKTIFIFITIISLLTVNVCAAGNSVPVIEVVSNADDIISVEGHTDANERVTLVILNPGKTEEQLAEVSAAGGELSGIVQHMAVVWPDGDGNYEFNPVAMNNNCNGGGKFKVIVNVGETKLAPIDYDFYFNSVKLDAIDAINDYPATGNSIAVADAYLKFGLSEYPLYKNGDIEEICRAIDLLKAANQPTGKLERNTDSFAEALKDAALLGAYNDHNISLLTDSGAANGKIAYAKELLDLISSEDVPSQEYADYLNINDKGRQLLNNELISSAYSDVDGIRNKFEELVAFYGIEYYKNAGFGHLDTFFENYRSIYDEYDFNFSGINSDNRNYVYSNLLSKKVADLDKLADRFNKLISDYSSDDDDRRGSGGSSFGGGTIPASTPNDYIIPKSEFTDLDNYAWAKDEINALREKGIINGKSATIFAPGDYVTRAEFLKMLMGVYGITSTTADTHFTDVANDWSKPYVIAAYEAGIAKGITDTTFAPGNFITREMGAVFAARAMGYKGIILENISDTFNDDAQIEEYAKLSVYCLKSAGIISGVGDNNFNPKGNLTRAEAAKIIYGIMLYN